MDEAYKFLQTEIKSATTVVAGISGGPDSMALLHLLIQLRGETNIKIICAHINHNVRRESEKEAVILKEYCEANDVIFEMMKIENYSDDNFHNEARIIRYNFFEELISKYNALYLITAHHGDDLIETVLMRIVRGSTLGGYAGFSAVTDRGTYKILRPLITMTKEDIMKYNIDNGISYATDASNASDKYTRNRYRKYVLPFLKQEDFNVHKKFLKFSQTISKYDSYFDKIIKNIIDEVYIENTLYINKFYKEDSIIQERIIIYILESIYNNDLSLISDAHTTAIMKLIKSSRPNSYICLPNNILVTKSYDKIIFSNEKGLMEEYKLELTSLISLPNDKIIEIIEETEDDSNYICRLDSKDITLPLYVRSKKPGDRMTIKGMNGDKKVKDIFINEKKDMNERENWPVVADSNDNIVWLPGLKKSKYNKAKKESYDIIIRYY